MRRINFHGTIYILILSVCLLLGAVIVFANSSSPEYFRYIKKIIADGQLEDVNQKYGLIELDGEAYNNSLQNANDVRIFDSDGKEVPYYKYSNFEKRVRPVNEDFKVLNKFAENNTISMTLVKSDVTILNDYTSINIEVYPENYYEQHILLPELSGSIDGKTYRPIKTNGFLIFSNQEGEKFRELRNSMIKFSPVNYPYLRLSLKIAEGNIKPENISRVWFGTKSEVIPSKKLLFQNILSIDSDKNVTTITMDTETNNVPVSRIVVNANNSNFNREVEVLTSKDNSKFSIIGTGAIGNWKDKPLFSGNDEYREFVNELYNEIKIFGAKANRYIKIRINNKDNAPLNIDDVKIYYEPDILVFEKDNIYKEPFYIYYGSQKYNAPNYDLRVIEENISDKNVQKFKLDKQEDNLTYNKQDIPFTDRSNVFIISAIVLAVVGMGFLIIRNFKKLLN